MFTKEIKEAAEAFLAQGRKEYVPQLSVDCVILSFHEDQLKVFLLHPNGQTAWMLPGGYVRHQDNLDDAANRVLFERAGLKDIFLKQFHTFGSKDRVLGKEVKEI